jgi:hypothetical protein
MQYQAYQSYDPTDRAAAIPAASVLGSSGTGKSTEIWAFAQLQQGRTRLWIHNIHWQNENFLMVKMLSNNQMTSITTSNVQLIHDHLNDYDLDLVVFDGTFNKATTSQFYRTAATNKLFTIRCSSGGQSVDAHPAINRCFHWGMGFYAEGFTLQELLEAEAILNPLRTEEEIERMYFYSGGSARQYYGYVNEIHVLCNHLDRRISAVPYDESFFRGKARDKRKWSDAMNELTTYRMKRPILVSEYVLRRFSDCCDKGFINAAKNPFIDDLAWQSACVYLDSFGR